jgi:hypothetical protein
VGLEGGKNGGREDNGEERTEGDLISLCWIDSCSGDSVYTQNQCHLS